MSKNKQVASQASTTTRYKMYKAGKNWLIGGIVTSAFVITGMLTSGPIGAHAATTDSNAVTQTAEKVSTDTTTVTGTPVTDSNNTTTDINSKSTSDTTLTTSDQTTDTTSTDDSSETTDANTNADQSQSSDETATVKDTAKNTDSETVTTNGPAQAKTSSDTDQPAETATANNEGGQANVSTTDPQKAAPKSSATTKKQNNQRSIKQAAPVKKQVKHAKAAKSDQSEFTFDGNTVTGYNGSNTDIEIPSQYTDADGNVIMVTSIGDSAFANKGLTSVKIPEGITYIGHKSFFGNELTEIALPSTLTSFSDHGYAFQGNHLVKFTIPDQVAQAVKQHFDGWASVFNGQHLALWHTNTWKGLDYTPNITFNGKPIENFNLAMSSTEITIDNGIINGINPMENYRHLYVTGGATIGGVPLAGIWSFYQTNPYIEVHYVDQATNGEIADTTQLSDYAGTTIPADQIQDQINALLAKGYTLVDGDENPVPSQTGTTFVDGQDTAQTYTLHFNAPVEQSVIINYVDADGNVLGSATLSGKPGDTLNIPEKTFTGYTKRAGQPTTYTVTAQADQTVSVIYDKETSQPEQPGNPGQPEEPSNPTNPTEPTDPTVPENPVVPEQPTTPENPGTPEQPTNPVNPITPETPAKPATPSTPSTPNESSPVVDKPAESHSQQSAETDQATGTKAAATDQINQTPVAKSGVAALTPTSATKLPQTGEKDQHTSLIGLVMLALGSLGLISTNKQKRED